MSVGLRSAFVNVGLSGRLNRRLAKIDEVASEQEQNGEFGERQDIAGNKSAKSKAIQRTSSTRFDHTILRFSPFFRF